MSIEIENKNSESTVSVSMVETKMLYEAEYAMITVEYPHGYFLHNKIYQLFEDHNEEIYARDEDGEPNYGILNVSGCKLYKMSFN